MPPVTTTTASGSGSVAVDSARNIAGSIITTGITGTAAHIHPGAVGVAGPFIIPLTQTAAGSGVWNIPAGTLLSQLQYDALLADGLYFNVHSSANLGGEIRGQISKGHVLTGAQEVPPVTTTAAGVGTLVINPTASSGTHAIVGGITTTGITGTAAHIHPGAVGLEGAPIITLTETVAGSGVWTIAAGATLTVAQYSDYLAGNLYFNVHSSANVDGEIRGQIVVP